MEKINPTLQKIGKFTLALLFSITLIEPCLAGQELPWESIPKPVQATVLENGGTSGQSVDLENKEIDGKKVYEAGVKDKEGKITDLVITEDGKLVDQKHDDESDKAQEKAAKPNVSLPGVQFSHPREITNPYLPLATVKQDIIEGTEDGKKTRVERTALLNKHKSFKINDQMVESLVFEDRAFVDGVLEEVALDYFAQDDAGIVYYFGEEVNEYDKAGKVINHDGSWMLGKDTVVPGVIITAKPKVGEKFKSENVSQEINESDEIVSISETVKVPAGTFKNCVKIKETLGDGKTELKYYAPGVGVVREVPSEGDEQLVKHTKL